MEFKIAVIGSKASGKSTYIERIENGNYLRECGSPDKTTTFTYAIFDDDKVVDCSTVLAFEEVRDKGAYFITLTFEEKHEVPETGYDGELYIFNLADKKSFDEFSEQINRSKTNNVLVCGSKMDLPQREVSIKKIRESYKGTYFDLSARTCYNFEKPINHFLRLFANNTNLQIF